LRQNGLVEVDTVAEVSARWWSIRQPEARRQARRLIDALERALH